MDLKKYKKKRIVPRGWKEITIGDVFRTSSGATPLSTEVSYYANGTIPWINSGELDNPYIYDTTNFISQKGFENSSTEIYPIDTVLVAMYGATAGKASILKMEACTNQAVCAILPNKEYSSIFLKYSIDTLYDHLVGLSSGSARDNLSQTELKKLKLIMPVTKREQDNIVSILSLIDHKIELNRLINQNLEAMITDIMDYKFLSNIEKLPKRRIGDIALIKAGGDCPQEWSKYKTKDYQIPIYSNGTDNEGLYGYTKEPVILERSVTVAARGTIGYCEIREGGYVPIIRLLAVTPNDIGGDVYLHQIFNRIKFKNDGSIQQQLTVPSIASIEIPYPDNSALKTFANLTYPLIEKIKRNKIQIEELTKQRDELLPLLMNGQVSVNSDLSDD